METDVFAKARRAIGADPDAPASAALARLLEALRNESSFDLGELYSLPLEDFELALEAIGAWRLQRYYRGNAVTALASGGAEG